MSTVTNRVKRAAIYGRVSTDQQTDNTSLEEQRRINELHAKQQGWKVVDSYYDIISGGSTNRPELQRMREDAKAGKFEAVLFTKLDRFARNSRDMENLYHEFGLIDVELVCVSDPSLNSSGKMGKVIRSIMGTFAEFERETIRERTSGGRKIKWRNGTAFMGELPFAYVKDANGKIVIDEERATLYKKIVSMYLDERLNSKKIALELTRQGIPTPTAQKGKAVKSTRWNPTTVLNMLKNPAYIGEGLYNKKSYSQPPEGEGKPGRNRLVTLEKTKPEGEWIKFAFPPIISKDIFQQIQARMQTQKIKPKRVYKGYEDHFLFDGLIYCGECGSRMGKSVKTEKNGKARLYYTCYWHATSADIKKVAGRSCILKAVNANETDDQLFNQIADLLVKPESLISSWFRDIDFNELEKRVALLEKKDKQLKKKLSEGFELITGVSDVATKKIYQDGQKKIEREWQDMQADLTFARQALEDAANKNQRYEDFKNALNKPLKGWRRRFKTEVTLQQFLTALPFSEKKRLCESIVAPEQGGKCFVQYIRPVDYLDSDELNNIPKKHWHMPQMDRAPYAYGSFMIDFNKIEAVISSLNRDDLLKKVDSCPTPPRGQYAH